MPIDHKRAASFSDALQSDRRGISLIERATSAHGIPSWSGRVGASNEVVVQWGLGDFASQPIYSGVVCQCDRHLLVGNDGVSEEIQGVPVRLSEGKGFRIIGVRKRG